MNLGLLISSAIELNHNPSKGSFRKMIERMSLTSSFSGDVSSLSRTKIFPLVLSMIRRTSSKPNLHNLSLWVTTTSPISPLNAKSKMELKPFLLKLRPDPISLMISWLGNLHLKNSTCLSKSSF